MIRDRRLNVLFLAVLLLSLAVGAPTARASGGGQSVDPKIVGGGPADPGEYPFMAAILNESITGNDYQKQFCGGSLIDDDWVLTAAHCVEGVSASTLAVAVGRTVLTSSAGQRVAVAAVHVQPSFGDPSSLAHDAALLQLATPVAGIAPITLAGSTDDRFEVAGTPLTVIGWGNTSARGRSNYPNELREGEVFAVSDEQCGSAYGASLHAPSMVCAAANGTDSCQGDSGGPLFATEAGVRVQVGIVSWGNGCAKKRFPGVYGEVNDTTIRSWITATAGL